MPQQRIFMVKMVVDDKGQFQIQGNGMLTPAEVIAGMEMYKHQLLANVLHPNSKSIPGFNPREIA